MTAGTLGGPWVVTGGAGFLGSHLVERLLARRTPVVVLDTFSSGPREHLTPYRSDPNFHLAELDIRNVDGVVDLLKDRQPSVVVHLAALHYIPAASADPPEAVSLNVHGTQALLTACYRASVRTFWFASTADVYAPSEEPHVEDGSPVGPINIYGLSKLIGEQLVALEAKQRPECRFVLGRLFNLYGPRETNPHILPEIFNQCRQAPNEPLRLGNIGPKRDFVPVADAARAVIDSAERAPAGVTKVNIATGASWSIQELIDTLSVVLARPLPVETDPTKVRAVERHHLQADVRRLRELIGWAPHSDLERGLGELVKSEQLC